MSRPPISTAVILLVAFCSFLAPRARGEGAPLDLTLRSREKVEPAGSVYEVVERAAAWDPKKTAVIVIDVWDKHWCDGANRRVAEMAPRFKALVNTLRDRGVFVVHAPSDTMKTYEGTPGRKLAQQAPGAPVPDGTTFKWNYLDPAAEGALPIDDSDGGCDCQPQCKNHIAWKGQHPAIEIRDGDAISADGREVYNLLQQRGIDNVIVCGVHTNMCILGRPFGIRQLRRMGKNVALVRDLTDTMYNPRMRPFVAHAKGTDLVIEHVERHWAPTITSAQVLDARTPRAAGAAPGVAALSLSKGTTGAEPRIVFVIAEDEYKASETLPRFAAGELEKRFGWKPRILQSDSKTDIPGLEALKDADLLVMYMHRRTLPDAQLAQFKAYFDAGKPVVAVRTASHAFQNWLEFDKVVLGCNYGRHHGTGKEGEATAITPFPEAANHPILRGVLTDPAWRSNASLYRVSPLLEGTTPLLKGKWRGEPEEPVAWTNTYKGGRVFYTSLGHPDDFNDPHFRRLLTNSILWALDRPIPR
jgi:nicotinamidase-related amidase/type 1 glutamine amidotransferase